MYVFANQIFTTIKIENTSTTPKFLLSLLVVSMESPAPTIINKQNKRECARPFVNQTWGSAMPGVGSVV